MESRAGTSPAFLSAGEVGRAWPHARRSPPARGRLRRFPASGSSPRPGSRARLGDGAQVFDGLDISFKSGRIIGLAAKSGGGKTTLGYLLAGLLAPTDGKIVWQGEKLSPSDLLKKVSYLFQFPERQIFADSVYNEIAFGLKQHGISDDDIDKRIKWSLEIIGLSYREFADRSPYLLSGGEMRKIALASVIALRRPLTVYDEPTAELDFTSVEKFKSFVRDVKNSGMTQIVISHDTDFLFDVCDDIVILKGGAALLSCDKFELIKSAGIFEECDLSTPGIIAACQNVSLRDFVVHNRIGSITELSQKLKQIA